MDFKKLFGVGAAASLALMAGCGDDSSTSAKDSEKDRDPVVDTLYVITKDTLVQSNVDTLVLNNVDTLVLNNVDTLYVRDTLVVKDTVVVKDTLVVLDTLVGLNGESCSAEDTVSSNGLPGFNITCGTTRVGTLWNGEKGSSAYEQAVAAGFVGTEEEWQATIAKRINQDHFVDFRDGQEYRTVKIGNQTWMAENLNYRYLQKTDDFDSSSFCFDGLLENCDKYGRLYLYSAAIDSAGALANGDYECGDGLSCEDEMPDVVKGICPDGWHLPDTTEFRELLNFVDPSDNDTKDISGLKSTYGWREVTVHATGQKVIYGGPGSDIYGYEAFPAGHGNLALGATMNYELDNVSAFFWTANPEVDDATKAHLFRITSFSYLMGAHSKSDASSIRCVKDLPVVEEEEEDDE